MDILQAASRDHIPVNPSRKTSVTPLSDYKKRKGGLIIPASMDRPSIDSVIEAIMAEDWYKDQIVERRVFDPKDGRIGACCLLSTATRLILTLAQR